jgi:hypothetical protein
MGLRVEWQAFGCESKQLPLPHKAHASDFMPQTHKLLNGLKLM